MTPLGNLFDEWRAGRVCFMGLGNPDYGDDGFGVRLAEELIKAGIPDVVIAGTAPEQRLGEDRGTGASTTWCFSTRLILRRRPDRWFVMDAREIAVRFPADFDSQDLTFGSGEMVEANGRPKVWLLGVQPGSVKDEPVSLGGARQLGNC